MPNPTTESKRGEPTAHLEITGGIVRVLPSNATPFEDPFEFSFSIIGDERVATIKGLQTSRLTTAHRRAIFACLAKAGFKEVRWARHKGRNVRQMRYNLSEQETRERA